MLNIMDGLEHHLVVGLFCNCVAEAFFNSQHVLPHLVQNQHIKWDSKNGKDDTKHLARHGIRADVAIAFAEQNSTNSQSKW